MKVVVAHYNENIAWTDNLSNVVIYNKGTPVPGRNMISLPNVGREGHTYYKYIVDNYDALDDYTVFLQGHPFDHSPNLFGQIEAFNNDVIKSGYKTLSSKVLPCTLNGCMFHPGLPLRSVWRKLFGQTCPEPSHFTFGAGAQFIVSRDTIRRRPKEFYQQIVDMLSTSVSPIEGYVIERLHTLIFTYFP